MRTTTGFYTVSALTAFTCLAVAWARPDRRRQCLRAAGLIAALAGAYLVGTLPTRYPAPHLWGSLAGAVICGGLAWPTVRLRLAGATWRQAAGQTRDNLLVLGLIALLALIGATLDRLPGTLWLIITLGGLAAWGYFWVASRRRATS
ncbi:MAG: hypothetical protein PHW74_03660 [Desulfobacca sp.]|nr:hypothetical protein [Desulfobacca sp.]